MKAPIAILAFPDRPAAVPPASASDRLLAKIEKVARYKRNPRTAAYMRTLAETELPGVEVMEVAGTVPVERIAGADAIVLLWADATGYGWAPLERAVFGAKRPGASVSALNGRRRRFELSSGTLLACRVRRVVERLWLGEAVLAVALLLAAPFLLTWDFLRGHR
jgi:hypothetical protein